MMKTVTIYTDGACSGNPGPGGWGAVLLYGAHRRELSGGELQRFCVARALMSGANFLICDEISTMLDVITQAQIWNKILEEAAAQNMGLIAVTHNRALANRVCTRVYDLSTGESWIPETQKLPGAPS